MKDLLISVDKQLFLWLNGTGQPFFDEFMLFMSAKLIWIPLYGFLIFFLYKNYGFNFWKPLLMVIITVSLADQITSGFMKPFFERLRPCNDPELKNLVSLVGKCGGRYGFASSHAANTLGLATFYLTFTRNRWFLFLLLWALIVSYSRIYLGVHFPGDIIIGGLIGAGLGYVLGKITLNIWSWKVNTTTFGNFRGHI